MYLFLFTGGLILAWLLTILWDKHRRRTRAKVLETMAARPLEAWEIRCIERYCRIWGYLNKEERKNLGKNIRLFLQKIYFEPCGGLPQVTDEMKIAIAANACIPLLGGRLPFFPGVRDVLLYPDDFFPEKEPSEAEDQIASGEATSNGNVILAWTDVSDCGQYPFRESNVVIHEFAHMIDFTERTDQGRSPLAHLYSPIDFFGYLSGRFKTHWLRFRDDGYGILNEYAGTNPEEFFAVATEYFYEVPDAFKKDYPEMYELMEEIYGRLSYQ